VSSSGLIYAVIVGAWAAYLVPMWLRRQDELNEARPTERFSTAIRLLSGRAAMERRVSRNLDGDDGAAATGDSPSGAGSDPASSGDQQPRPRPRAQSGPQPAAPRRGHAPVQAPAREHAVEAEAPRRDSHRPDAPHPGAQHPGAQQVAAPQSAAPRPAVRHTPHPTPGATPTPARRPEQQRRATLLARRRRIVILLFVAFTLGMVAAAVGGVALLWVPAVPAVLFSAYIAHLRRQERRRFEVKLDRRRAAEAAQQLRERERERRRTAAEPATEAVRATPRSHGTAEATPPAGRTAAGSGVHHVQALVDAADSDDADDSGDEDEPLHTGTQHPTQAPAPTTPAGPTPGEPDRWDPVPVPLPTYVTAPVAPRNTGGLDLNDPDTWSSGRSTTTPPAPTPKRPPATPLFDQYADDAQHPRAANQ
jgi:hypothetical protein